MIAQRTYLTCVRSKKWIEKDASHQDEHAMLEDINLLIRLVTAITLAGMIGWERETIGKAAGVRTHMLVGLSAATFVVLGELFVIRFSTFYGRTQFDPIRIIEAVVTGVSFLGAGTIFVSRGREQVRGLTTAASIWITSAVGIMAGIERYFLAIGITVLILFVLYILRRVEKIKSKARTSQNQDWDE